MAGRDELHRHPDGRVVGVEPQLPHGGHRGDHPEYPKYIELPNGKGVEVLDAEAEQAAMAAPENQPGYDPNEHHDDPDAGLSFPTEITLPNGKHLLVHSQEEKDAAMAAPENQVQEPPPSS